MHIKYSFQIATNFSINSLQNIFTFFNTYMFRNWHDKIYVSKILKHIFLISSSSRTGKKGNNIFSFVIPYRKGRVDNDRGQGHFWWKKLLFPINEWGLARSCHADALTTTHMPTCNLCNFKLYLLIKVQIRRNWTDLTEFMVKDNY